MNPRSVVVALITMVVAVTGYTVVQNIGDVPANPTSTVMSVQRR